MNTFKLWIDIVIALLLLASAACFKVGHWYTKEAHYWFVVGNLVTIDPSTEPRYRKVLAWARTNRPSVWTRLKPWRAPEVRMKEAQ